MSEYWTALESGTTLVSANTRFARDWRRAFDLRMRNSGKLSWAAADILDLNAWIRRTWDTAVEHGVAPAAALLRPVQEQLVWEQIIEQSVEGRGLLQVPATAAAASEVFGLTAAWRVPLSQIDCTGFEDAAAFADWAHSFEETLAARGWISAAQIPDVLVCLTETRAIRAPEVLLHAGFDELTPLQQRLFAALAEAGCRVEAVPASVRECQRRVRTGTPDAAAEIGAAAAWARETLTSRPSARIGVVIPDLQNRRALVERVFEDALHPSCDPVPCGGRPVFHISAGQPLIDVPMVAAAFQTLELGLRTISASTAGMLMRSPYLADSEAERGARSMLDAELRRRGFAEMTARDLLRLASRTEGSGAPRGYACPSLARLFRAWRRALVLLPERQPPSGWSRTLSRLLRLSGWPGARTLDSAEYQALRSWNELLSEFAALDLVSPPVCYSDAVGRLRRLAADTPYGPADEDAPVQIMGVLESAGSEFDALWIAGLEDRAWPAPPSPSPFLPPPLQRDLGLPHSSSARELAFARRTLSRLLGSAPDVIASYPRREEDTDLRPSPLILELEEVPGPSPSPSIAAILSSNGNIPERFEDRIGPTVEPGALSRGGMSILERQAACPFGAFAQFRLEAKPLEEPALGLSPQERGMLMHAALENFWAEMRTRDALVACPAEQRAEAVRTAAAAAIESKVRGRAVARSSRLTQLEQLRLERILNAWLDKESLRGPFTVKQREEPGLVEAGGLTAEVRVDRVDQLPDGREIIIDYKTSLSSPTEWEGDRPDAPQLPLYAANHRAPLAAVLFAQVVPGDLGFKGLGENAGVAGTEYATSRTGRAAGGSLADHVADWRRTLDALGAAFCAGFAEASPKRAENCRSCGFPALCRIADLGVSGDDDADRDSAFGGDE